MVGKKRLCNKCQVRHGRPTGAMCTRTENFEQEIQVGIEEVPEDGAYGGAPLPVVAPPADQGVNDRMDHLEEMIRDMARTMANSRHLPENVRRSRRDHSSSSSCSSMSGYSSDDARAPRRRRDRRRPFSYRHYLKKGDVLDNFEGLMVVSLKTMLNRLDQGGDVRGIINHSLLMAEKESSHIYVVKAAIAYDASVRDRANGPEGPDAFNVVKQEDVLRYYSFENSKRANVTVSNSDKKGSKVKRRVSLPCFKFNADGGCTIPQCNFTHKCSICESREHSAKTCGVNRGKYSK